MRPVGRLFGRKSAQKKMYFFRVIGFFEDGILLGLRGVALFCGTVVLGD